MVRVIFILGLVLNYEHSHTNLSVSMTLFVLGKGVELLGHRVVGCLIF